MLADNLRSESLKEAVCKTLDGKHPCALCNAIAAGKKSERKTEFSSPISKLEFPPIGGELSLPTPPKFQFQRSAEAILHSLSREPLTPPPRLPLV